MKPIDLDNYEAHALDYLEGGLSPDENKAFEAFLAKHPEIAAQVNGLAGEMPRLQPDLSIVFDTKETLRRRSLVKPLYYYAAAAAAVLLAGYFGFQLLQTPPQPGLSPAPVTAQQPTVPPAAADTAAIVPAESQAARAMPASTAIAAADAVRNAKENRPQTIVAQQKPAATEEKQEVFALPETAPEPAVILADNLPVETIVPSVEEHGETLLASAAPERNEVVVIETTEYIVLGSTEADPAGNETGDQERALLRSLLRKETWKGIARQVIISPLAELTPVSVYHDNNERVVEFASIPISRRPSDHSKH